jgi:hypothetical protein
MGTKDMKREERIRLTHPLATRARWLHRQDQTAAWEEHGWSAVTMERYVTEWTVVEEGKQ